MSNELGRKKDLDKKKSNVEMRPIDYQGKDLIIKKYKAVEYQKDQEIPIKDNSYDKKDQEIFIEDNSDAKKDKKKTAPSVHVVGYKDYNSFKDGSRI